MRSARQFVTPAKAGVQGKRLKSLDSRLRGNDGMGDAALISTILSHSPTALRQRLRLVVAGDFGAAIEDPGVALGDGAVKRDEFRVEIADRPRLEHEMMVAILTAHQGGTILASELRHRRRYIADGKPDAPIVRRVGRIASR